MRGEDDNATTVGAAILEENVDRRRPCVLVAALTALGGVYAIA